MPCAMTSKQKRAYNKRKYQRQKQKQKQKRKSEMSYYKYNKKQYYVDMMKKGAKGTYSKSKRAIRDMQIQKAGKYYCNKCHRYHTLKSKIGKYHLIYRR